MGSFFRILALVWFVVPLGIYFPALFAAGKGPFYGPPPMNPILWLVLFLVGFVVMFWVPSLLMDVANSIDREEIDRQRQQEREEWAAAEAQRTSAWVAEQNREYEARRARERLVEAERLRSEAARLAEQHREWQAKLREVNARQVGGPS